MCTKMMYNVTVFKNVFQNQMAKFHTATLQLLLHQLNMNNTKKLEKIFFQYLKPLSDSAKKWFTSWETE